MARIKKSLSDKEQELKQIIADAKKKLSILHTKQKADLGELAFKHKLHEFDFNKLDVAFRKLAMQLSNEK